MGYPIQSATVQVRDDSVIPDFSGAVNTYVIITNDALDFAGASYTDQFTIQIPSRCLRSGENNKRYFRFVSRLWR